MPGWSDHPLDDDTVAVWWSESSAGHTALSLLSAEERERFAAYRQPADRLRFATGVTLTRLVVGGLLGLDPADVAIRRDCPDCDRPHGRPWVPGSGLDFSLAHAGDVVGLAVLSSPCPEELPDPSVRGPGSVSKGAATDRARRVGLDVEPLAGRSLEALRAEILGPAERRRPIASDSGGLLRTWVRKEAVLKALGTGLATPMTSFAVSPPDQAAAVHSGPATGTQLVDLDGPPTAIASLCVLGPAASPVERDARPLYASWVGRPVRSTRPRTA